MTPDPTPFGAWPSPLTAADLTRGTRGLGSLCPDRSGLHWLEARPSESGRVVIMRHRDGTASDIAPPEFSARTRAHEYGGGALAVRDGLVLACRWEDQRVCRIAERRATPVTPEPAAAHGIRWADLDIAPGGAWFVAVRETHGADRPYERTDRQGNPEAVNQIVAVALHGEDEGRPGAQQVLADGRDFVAGPRVSPDGRRLCWLAWDHPDMPWDAAELWVGDLDADGGAVRLTGASRLAGGDGTSVAEARWLDDGRLLYLLDPDGWWNPFVWDGDETRRLDRATAEYGQPHWQFGGRTVAELADGRIAARITDRALSHLHIVGGERVPGPWTAVRAVGAHAGRLAAIVASPSTPFSVVLIDPDEGHVEVLRTASDAPVPEGIGTHPEPITFDTGEGAQAHAFYYPPVNAGCAGPPDELPPLVVATHGGPTGNTSAQLDLAILYWTSRGFALVDVNYRGSTGFGRSYREALHGRWGVVDVEDAVAAARHLVGAGLVDGDRIVIRGGSAGGYTTLMALCTSDLFAAGASYYGVADAAALARETHKFESRYLDRLIGPYPEAEGRYRERSPVHLTDGLNTPMILLQGAEDEVVPPAQAEVMVAALDAKKIPHAYLLFDGEQHGFRRAETIIRAHEAELAFYAEILGFTAADELPPLPMVTYE